MIVVQLLILLLVANGAPAVAGSLMGHWGARPIDGGRRWLDHRRLLGVSKTWRGLIAGVVFAAFVGAVIGMGLLFSAGFGFLSLTGDLLSSFIKRRLGLVASARARGLDQIPEALLPMLVCAGWLDYGLLVILVTVGLFVLINITTSPLLYRIGLRKRPY